MMKAILDNFVRDESGATAIEYALIAAFISIAILASLAGLGTRVVGLFTNVGTKYPDVQ